MADKKKNFNEVVDEELDDEVEVEVDDTDAEEEVVVETKKPNGSIEGRKKAGCIAEEQEVETKKPNGFIETCKKVGRITEAALAIFGGAVGGLMIYDCAKTRRQRKNYIPAQQPQQIPSSTTEQILDDVKVETF